MTSPRTTAGPSTAADPSRRDAADDIAAMAGSLRLSATRLARQLRQQADTGLTPSQLSALASIERHGPLTLGALAECERVAPPSITKVVTKLEAQDLIAREQDPADRRIGRVTVTAAGRKLIAESRRRKNEWLADRLRQLEPDERARLAAALEVLEQLSGRGDP